jgi:uncharacterized NAD(P)/FAD-binding protein YdhS
MKHIGIIGAGFSGMMTAVHLIENSVSKQIISMFDTKERFGKGIAYSPYSKSHLLNVPASKMSAFVSDPDHFVNWLLIEMKIILPLEELKNSFQPRYVYGEYLTNIWEKALETAKNKGIEINCYFSEVIDLKLTNSTIELTLADQSVIEVSKCVLATGNQLPKNFKIETYSSKKIQGYFQNPWNIDSVIKTENIDSVLIIGNGLTMIDTVLGLMENNFEGQIYTISPHGFNCISSSNGDQYKINEFKFDSKNASLKQVVDLVNKELKIAKKKRISNEYIFHEIRPYTQLLWKSFSSQEKAKFLSTLEYLWNSGRHRVPVEVIDKINNLIDLKLQIIKGKILSINYLNELFDIFLDSKDKSNLKVKRIINCTGSATNLDHIENNLLTNLKNNKLICQDEFNLGIKTNIDSFQIINSNGEILPNIYTLGPTLKGELWETTSLTEIRVQAEKIGEILAN